MAFMADFATIGFSNIFISNDKLADAVSATTALFKRLSVDDQLAVLWYAYAESGSSMTPAAVGSARLQLAEGLLNQIKQMSQAEQLQVMRDLATNKDSQISRSYGILSPHTKLAFWCQLAQLMVEGFVVPVPPGYEFSRDGQKVLEAIKLLDFGQQITVLRNAVIDMGVDPLAH